jgi:Sec7-like guanine-nucleotide exchange factor
VTSITAPGEVPGLKHFIALIVPAVGTYENVSSWGLSASSLSISKISPSPQETRVIEIANAAAKTGAPMLTQRFFINISHNPDYSII